MACLIINKLKGIENRTYLELGIGENVNFSKIHSQKKTSVDTNGKATFTCTTDIFFTSISKSDFWDIIFIDANHDYNYILRDFNNSIKHCNEWLLIHDMIPPTKELCESCYCSDSYKLLFYLINETNYKIYPMDENMGLTLIKMPVLEINPSEKFKTTSYEVFKNFIGDIHLYNQQEIVRIINI